MKKDYWCLSRRLITDWVHEHPFYFLKTVPLYTFRVKRTGKVKIFARSYYSEGFIEI